MKPAQVALSLIAAWEAHDVAQAAALLTDDFVLTGPAPVPLNKQAYLGFQKVHTDGFPDWNFNAQVVGEEGENVRLAIQITATHLGTYDVAKLGIPVPPIAATAKRRQWPRELLTFTVRDQKVASLHVTSSPEGGVMGTLVWLGVNVPAANGASLQEIGYKWSQLFSASGDLALIDEIVASDFRSHSAPAGLPAGREGVCQWVRIFRQAFPDIYSNAEDVIVAGDKVVERFAAGGTHLGPFFGMAPTGRKAKTTGINIFRIANGKIVEHWGNSDDMGLMNQLLGKV